MSTIERALVGFLLLTSTAAAMELGDLRPGVLPTTGLVVVVGDPLGQLGSGVPRLLVVDPAGDEVSLALADGGAVPDDRADDGIYTGLLPAPPSGELVLDLRSAMGESLWSDTVTTDPDSATPAVRILLGADRVEVELATAENASTPVAGERSPPATVPPPSIPSRPLPWLLALGLLALGAVGGGAGAWWMLRRRHRLPPLEPVSPSAESAETLLQAGGADGVRIWTAPGDSERLEAVVGLVRTLAGRGPVLLAPRPAHRTVYADRLRGVPTVHWLREERPEVRPLLAAAAALAPGGPVVLVVEGFEGLEPPAEDEPQDAVVEELCEESTVPAVVILLQGDRFQRTPHARLEPHGDHLEDADTGLRIPMGGDGTA